MLHPRAAAAAASIAAIGLLTAACQAGAAAGRASASASAGCGAGTRLLPTNSDFPGFTQDGENPDMGWPGTSAEGHPNAFELHYVCGEATGFTANIALSGVTGQIIRRNQHRVLEINVTIFQFTSAQIATEYVAAGKPIKILAGLALQYDYRRIPVEPVPGALVTREYQGADIPSDEGVITIRAPLGDDVVRLDLVGGTQLDWSDARPYWTTIDSLLKPLVRPQNPNPKTPHP